MPSQNTHHDELPRTFGLGNTATMLSIACVVGMLLNSEGILQWARRLEVGRLQDTLTGVLTPLHAVLTQKGLTTPRHWAGLYTALAGSAADPVLAEGWTPVAAKLPPEVTEFKAEDVGTSKTPEPGPTQGVLVLGDSMIAGSLGSTMERKIRRQLGLPVRRAAQLGTGLARPDVYDWMKVVPLLLERERPRFVVVSLGSNDAINLRDEEEERLDFGEPRWREVYESRVEAMMRALAGTHTEVFWLSLPPMRDRRLSGRTAVLNSIFERCAQRVPRVELIELKLLVANAEQEYATFVEGSDGRILRYRLDDGVHLAPAGSRAVATEVLARLTQHQREDHVTQ